MNRIFKHKFFSAIILLFIVHTFRGSNYYITSNAGEPWSTTSNINAMDTVFGIGGWTKVYFQTVNASSILVLQTDFIFMEGGSTNALALNTFINANRLSIENWVSGGGHLLINAAPNQGGNISLGFGGTILKYDTTFTHCTNGNASSGQTNHPIFSGPYVACGTAFTGNYFAHAIIIGGTSVPIITGTSGNSLTELTWGTGKAMFGGMTTTNFHSPIPNGRNLLKNILTYLGVFKRAENEIILYNSFSPNNDGLNDVFEIDYIIEYPKNHVYIYNRWGMLLWDKEKYDNTTVVWEGKDKSGNALAPGTYFYLLEIDGKKTEKHWVELTK